MYQTEHIDEIFAKSKRSFQGIPLPLEIELSLLDSCNRACPNCPRNNDTIAPNTSLEMPQKLYKQIARQLQEIGFNGLVMLGGYSEPLLYKNIVDVVRTFNFTYVDIVTNGDLLTDDLVDYLIDAGVHRIMISLYEPTKKFDKYQYNEKIILRNRYDYTQWNNRAGTISAAISNTPCYYPSYMMMIDCNGDVFPCPQEWHRRLKVGNCSFTHLFYIWRDMSLRHKLGNGDRTIFPCRICNVNGTLRGAENFELFTKLQRK